MKIIDKKQVYKIIKDIAIPVIEMVMTIMIAIYANRIAIEANIINKKSEPLIYHIVESNGEGKYNIDYNGAELEIPFKAHALKVEQGVIDVIKFIVYDGKNFTICNDLDYDFLEEFRKNDYTMEIETEENFTHQYNGICYDYFFIYIKSGDGKERIDLAYTGINLTSGTANNPEIESKMSILKLNNESKNDMAYYEMLEVYKDLEDNFSKLLKSDTEIY